MSVDGVHVMPASYQFLALKFYLLPMDVSVQLTSVLLVSVKCLLLHVTYIYIPASERPACISHSFAILVNS